MRPLRAALSVVLTFALALAAGGCSGGTAPPTHPTNPPTLAGDCVQLRHGGAHLSVEVVGGLRPLDPETAALNTGFTAGGGVPVELAAWLLLGARTQQDADGAIFVYATDRTPDLSAAEALQRTLLETSGAERDLEDLHLGRATVAGRRADTASLASATGHYDAWTFTEGRARFIEVAQQRVRPGAPDLSRLAPGLLGAGDCGGS